MKLDYYWMIIVKSLDPKDKDVESNLKPIEESKIEKVILFKDLNPRSIRIKKNFLNDLKQKLIKLLKKYHECFALFMIDMPMMNP